MKGEIFHVKVGGDFACFTQPIFKAERNSYLVMTPSAARGILEAIFWKPTFRWQIQGIKILKPISQMSILRNEISAMKGGKPISIEKERVQRTSLILKDVEYIISASMFKLPHIEHDFSKYPFQFKRRLEKGQCHHTPYLGTREFAAWFEEASGSEQAQTGINFDLQMLFDIAFIKDDKKNEMQFHQHDANGKATEVKGYRKALFHTFQIREGAFEVPQKYYQELYQSEGIYV